MNAKVKFNAMMIAVSMLICAVVVVMAIYQEASKEKSPAEKDDATRESIKRFVEKYPQYKDCFSREPRLYKRECLYCGENWFHPVDFECPNNRREEFELWAYGKLGAELRDKDDLWNELHSDLFRVEGYDGPYETTPKMYEAFIAHSFAETPDIEIDASTPGLKFKAHSHPEDALGKHYPSKGTPITWGYGLVKDLSGEPNIIPEAPEISSENEPETLDWDPITFFVITKEKHKMRFQGVIMIGGDIELEWDDFTLGAQEYAFDNWLKGLTVEEIRENWGIDVIKSFEIEAKELCPDREE